MQQDRQLSYNTPIIIGAGQYVERLHTLSEPPFSCPMQLAATACQAAIIDAGVTAGEIDTIAVIRLFSDTAKAWASPFGGSNNPPESVAQRIGAKPTHRIYSDTGGREPLALMVEMFQAIARGEKQLVLLVGAEAIASQRFALRNGFALGWAEQFDALLDNREYRKRFAAKEEVSSGLRLPVHYYALIENSQAHRMGHDLQQHRLHMARMLAPFSQVAAANPYSQAPVAYTAQELAEPSPDNYPISLPYSKRLIAQDSVNQSAALLLTSVGTARRLGVDPRQWLFLGGYAAGVDQYLSLREDPGCSLAMRQVLTAALERAEATCTDMDFIDIYSCFPCAVQAACDVLDLPTHGSRPLTVTGGLPFFGGPGNNYSMHALAEVATRLRGHQASGLVTANGGMLSKHAAAMLTTDPARARRIDWSRFDDPSLDCTAIPARAFCHDAHSGNILSYTVAVQRERADLGIVLAETPAGERFLASSIDPAITAAMLHSSPIGRGITVHRAAEQRVFRFQD